MKTAPLLIFLILANATVAHSEESCLHEIWAENTPDSERAFDVANDKRGDDHFSCSAGVTPSRLKTSLLEIQAALLEGDAGRLSRQMQFPLVFVDRNGNSHRIGQDRFPSHWDEIFSRKVAQEIASAKFEDVRVAGYRGAFLQVPRLVTLWWSRDHYGGTPILSTVLHTF